MHGVNRHRLLFQQISRKSEPSNIEVIIIKNFSLILCTMAKSLLIYLVFRSPKSRQMLSIKSMVKNDPLILWPLSSCRKQLDLIVSNGKGNITYIYKIWGTYDQTTWQVFISPVIYQWSRKMSRTNPFVILRCGLLTWLRVVCLWPNWAHPTMKNDKLSAV